MVAIGITLQPERRYLELVTPIAATADYVELAPETLWRTDEHGRFVPNGFHRDIAAFVDRSELRVVAHGTGLSLGSADPSDDARLMTWLARIRDDHATFHFDWYTDHLGVNALASQSLQLPIALPLIDATADLVATRLAALQSIVPDVGFENTVHYFMLGDWYEEPSFMQKALAKPRTWLLLDLHNLWTMAQNLDLDPRGWLARTDLTRVIEIHVSGGSESDPQWTHDGSRMRLDSHDDGVPEPVFQLLSEVLPQCPNLRGVTLERMEGSVERSDVPVLARELGRIREALFGRT